MQTGLRWLIYCCVAAILFSCTLGKKIAGVSSVSNISAIKLLDEYDIPHNLIFKNTTVGGLSGIDYDSANNCYYIICDDRSDINPARFYTAKINITSKGIDSAYFTAVTNLLQSNGNVYPNNLQAPTLTPDPEAIRYNPILHQMIWSSEGERIVKKKDTILEDPAISLISPEGKYIGSFELPHLFKMQSIQKGPRQNGVFEGMSFADNYKTLYANAEEPLYEDGPRADLTDNHAFIRILGYDVESRKNIKQFAYKLDPIVYPANPPTEFKINGVPDILSIGNDQLLVIERSYSFGHEGCSIRLFIADFKNATDIKENVSLTKNAQFKPMTKKLLLNLDDLGIFIDNVEGMTFGPILPNGHRTLILIADNNFKQEERSQVFLFEVL
ncbi:MAG: esterase-like activity of phytase family protein [Ferruginibacter sp.]